jgi:hypothetical protein
MLILSLNAVVVTVGGRKETDCLIRSREAKMTDQQLITLAIAIAFPLSMLLYSNSRVSDAKETLRAEIQTFRAELKLDLTERFNSVDRKLDELLRLSADHDQRITRLESR